MVKNYSSSQTTFKSTITACQSDLYVLDRVLLYSIISTENSQAVMMPFGTILDDYYDYFETLLEEVEVPKEYFYSPSGFSQYYYGDPGLDFLVLYFAKIQSLFDFNKEKIQILPLRYVKEINKLITLKRTEVTNSRNEPTVYSTFPDVVNQVQAYEDYFKV